MTDLDLDALQALPAKIRDDLPAHSFDCDRFQTYDYGLRNGKCDCTTTADITAFLDASDALLARVRELEAENKALRDTAKGLEQERNAAYLDGINDALDRAPSGTEDTNG